MKTGYKRVGPFLKSQAEVRADKQFWEGKGARNSLPGPATSALSN